MKEKGAILTYSLLCGVNVNQCFLPNCVPKFLHPFMIHNALNANDSCLALVY